MFVLVKSAVKWGRWVGAINPDLLDCRPGEGKKPCSVRLPSAHSSKSYESKGMMAGRPTGGLAGWLVVPPPADLGRLPTRIPAPFKGVSAERVIRL